MLEAVKKGLIANPNAFTSDVAQKFQENLAGAMPQDVLNELTDLLRNASDASTREEQLASLVRWMRKNIISLDFTNFFQLQYEMFSYAKPNKAKVTMEEFVSAVAAGNLDRIYIDN